MSTAFSDVFEYSTYRLSPELIAASADWVPVVTMDDGGGYDWATFHGWYSPSRRVYFYGGGAGCSCNSYVDYFTNLGDFESGDRAALMAALRRFAEDHRYTFGPVDLVDALHEANGFNPRGVRP